MKIRPEAKEDFDTIYNLIKIAFETAKVSEGNEQDFAARLRMGSEYIPELALVAEEEGTIVGHIMLTETMVSTAKNQYKTLLLAPLAVLLEYRRSGIGSKLIRESINRADRLGYESVFLVGDPEYYTRFGFIPSVEYGIRNSNKIPPQYVLACELQSGSLDFVNGEIFFETL